MLVTGAAGMLGRDLVPLLEAQGHDVTAVDLDVDITDADAVHRCVQSVRPKAIFHLAAWTDVDGAEEHEGQALAVNGRGARNVARAAAQAAASMVFVSTDYVFDGARAGDYAEDDPPAPLGAYGRTKLAGEHAVLSEHPGGVRIARTAWLYGSHGRNFVDTMRRLSGGRDEVAVVDDQEGSPTWTRDLAPALITMFDLPPGIYHVSGGGSATWADLAEAVFRGTGASCRVRRITTAELGRPAPRPARVVLAVTKPGAPRLRHWREALADYLRERSE